MNFAEPMWLNLLWACPALVALEWTRRALAQRDVRLLVGPALAVRLCPGYSRWRVALRAALLVLAMAALATSLARPRWGEAPRELRRTGRDVCFIIDVSRSMLAQDLRPNRLERAKLWVGDVIDELKGDRVALIAFAGTSVVKCPPTLDYGFFRMALDDLSTTSVTRGGTLIGDAIRRALSDVFTDQETRYRDIILITDGEDHGSVMLSAVERAREQKVRIIALGLGDPATGSAIPVRDERGRAGSLEHQGQTVLSRLDADGLRKAAEGSAGGVFLNVGTGNIELDKVYRQLRRNQEGDVMQDEEQVDLIERFQWPLGCAVLLTMLWCLTGEARRARA